MIRRPIIKIAFLLFLSPLAVSTALACRGKGYVEQEASSTIKGLPFPDFIEYLPRKSLRTPTCYWNGYVFSVTYGEENSDWAEISLRERDSNIPSKKQASDLEYIAQRTAELRNKLDSTESWTVEATNVNSVSGLAFLIKKNDRGEYKNFQFNSMLKSQIITIKYSTPNAALADEKALDFRNAYLAHLRAMPEIGFEPAGELP